jgi:hypothetical protein
MGSLIVAVLIIVILVSLFYKNNDNYGKEERENETLAKLKGRYQAALKAGDKTKARNCGLDYYAYLRNSRTLTSVDEDAIARDIANMPQDS